jgi:hypothetical protein
METIVHHAIADHVKLVDRHGLIKRKPDPADGRRLTAPPPRARIGSRSS